MNILERIDATTRNHCYGVSNGEAEFVIWTGTYRDAADLSLWFLGGIFGGFRCLHLLLVCRRKI
jgi:hypothetical protein